MLLKTKKNNIIVWSRNSVIPARLENKKVSIYFGNGFRKMIIRREHIGLKFGELAYTRKKNGNRFKKITKKK
jgi:ribosomal protein S19